MRNTDGYPYLVIDSDNAHWHADHSGYGYCGWQNPGEPHGFAAGDPVGDVIPRSEWHSLIKAGQGSFLSDLIKAQSIPAKNQRSLKFCWGFGSVRAVEATRAVAGLPFKDLSPESVCGPCTNWRNQGGYASEAFNQLQSAGACESSYMDAPNSLNVRAWKAGWRENAKLHEAVRWYEIGTSFDQVISCLLKRIPVAAGLSWWGHLVCFLDPAILPDGSVGVLFQNSWGSDWPTKGANGFATLSEAKATPSGAAAPLIATFSEN
jgi:hypothetical protein